jgi:hypothetical protein
LAGPSLDGTYQWIDGTVPIMFSEGGDPKDAFAGQSGYDPYLIKGLTVNFGSRIVLWLPAIELITDKPTATYEWIVIWRMRNVFDYRIQRIPYQYPKQGVGVSDTRNPADQNRVVIPAITNTVIYNEGEPPTGAPAVQNIRTEYLATRAISTPLPLLPDSNLGSYQQGILDPGTFGALALMPGYQQFEVQAIGNEMLIGLTKAPIGKNPIEPWDFSSPLAPDYFLSIIFGSGSGKAYPDVGVYAMGGVAP